MDIEKVKEFLKNIDTKDIKFMQHFYEKAKVRPINEGLVISSLKKTDKIINIEHQKPKREDEEKYKITAQLSNKYDLVVIVCNFKSKDFKYYNIMEY